MFLLWLLNGIVTLLAITSKASDQMPEATRRGLQNAKTLTEFEHYAALYNNSDMMADFNRHDYGISRRCDLDETCILIPVCVPIGPDPNDYDSEYFPRCVKLTKCVESTHDHNKRCHATIGSVNVTVLHFNHITNGQGTRRIRKLQMENHTSCDLEIGSPPEIHQRRHYAPKPSPPLPPASTTPPTLTTISKCTSYNQCPGNQNDAEAQNRDDCNECELFDSDCCSCICHSTRDEDGICTCSPDKK